VSIVDRHVIWTPADLARLQPITGSNPMRPVDSIVIHHTCGGSAETPQGIHAEHLRIGYGGIGYHFIITRDLRVWRGRPLWARGAHCRSNNSGRIGIALSGDYSETAPDMAMTRRAFGLIELLRQLYGDLPLFPHYSIPGSSTACPGPALVRQWATLGADWHTL